MYIYIYIYICVYMHLVRFLCMMHDKAYVQFIDDRDFASAVPSCSKFFKVCCTVRLGYIYFTLLHLFSLLYTP